MSRTYKDKIRALFKKNPNSHVWGWEYGYGLFYGGINSCWKKIRRKQRRAKEKSALRSGKQIPRFKKADEWDWF